MTWSPPAGNGYRFTSDYGPRSSPGGIGSTFHRGVDLAPPTPGQAGFPILAPAAGTIISRAFSTIRGHWTAIRHDDGTVTRYQHFPLMPWHPGGTRVAQGQILGHMGASGAVTGVHLHHEVFPPGHDWTSSANAVDPEPFYRARGWDLRDRIRLVDNTTPTTPGGNLPDVPTLPGLDPLTPDLQGDPDMKLVRFGSMVFVYSATSFTRFSSGEHYQSLPWDELAAGDVVVLCTPADWSAGGAARDVAERQLNLLRGQIAKAIEGTYGWKVDVSGDGSLVRV